METGLNKLKVYKNNIFEKTKTILK